MFDIDALVRMVSNPRDCSQRKSCLHRWAHEYGVGPLTYVMECDLLVRSLQPVKLKR